MNCETKRANNGRCLHNAYDADNVTAKFYSLCPSALVQVNPNPLHYEHPQNARLKIENDAKCIADEDLAEYNFNYIENIGSRIDMQTHAGNGRRLHRVTQYRPMVNGL